MCGHEPDRVQRECRHRLRGKHGLNFRFSLVKLRFVSFSRCIFTRLWRKRDLHSESSLLRLQEEAVLQLVWRRLGVPAGREPHGEICEFWLGRRRALIRYPAGLAGADSQYIWKEAAVAGSPESRTWEDDGTDTGESTGSTQPLWYHSEPLPIPSDSLGALRASSSPPAPDPAAPPPPSDVAAFLKKTNETSTEQETESEVFIPAVSEGVDEHPVDSKRPTVSEHTLHLTLLPLGVSFCSQLLVAQLLSCPHQLFVRDWAQRIGHAPVMKPRPSSCMRLALIFWPAADEEVFNYGK